MIALGMGLLAIDGSYEVAFEKVESFIDVLDKADVDRKAGFRLRYLRKPAACDSRRAMLRWRIVNLSAFQ